MPAAALPTFKLDAVGVVRGRGKLVVHAATHPCGIDRQPVIGPRPKPGARIRAVRLVHGFDASNASREGVGAGLAELHPVEEAAVIRHFAGPVEAPREALDLHVINSRAADARARSRRADGHTVEENVLSPGDGPTQHTVHEEMHGGPVVSALALELVPPDGAVGSARSIEIEPAGVLAALDSSLVLFRVNPLAFEHAGVVCAEPDAVPANGKQLSSATRRTVSCIAGASVSLHVIYCLRVTFISLKLPSW